MSLSTKIAHNTIVQVASKAIATALGLLTIAIMTRYLGKAGFGEYTTVIAYLTFFATIADLGLTLVTVQLISKPGADEKKIIGNLFSFRLLTALFFLGISVLIAIFLPYSKAVKVGIALTSFSFLFVSLNQILVGIFQKNLRMDRVAIAEVFSRAFLLLAIFAVYFFDYGLFGVLLATVLANLLSFAFHYFYSQKFVTTALLFDFSYWKEIAVQSWPIAVTIFFNLIYLRTDTIILSLVKDSTAVGIYGAAYKIIDVLVTIPFMFAGIILPLLTRAWFEKNIEFFKKVLQRSFDTMIMLALPMLAGTFFISPQIIAMIAGPEFGQSATVLRILIVAAALIFPATIYSHAVIAIDRQRKIIPAYIFVALSSLVLYIIFIPSYSYLAAAWITVYSELAIAIFSWLLVRRYSGVRLSSKLSFKILCATILMSIGLYLLQGFSVNIYINLLFASSFYFVCLYILGGISNKDLAEILNKKQR